MINGVRVVMEQLLQVITQALNIREFYPDSNKVNNDLTVDVESDEAARRTPHIKPSGSFEQVN